MTPSAGLRAEFPLLAANPGLHYLDSAATAQIHRSALDAVMRHETGSRANVLRGSHRLAEAADQAYDAARASVARFLNAPSADEIVFTSGATAALNLVAHAFGATLRRAIACWSRRPSTTATSCPGRCCAIAPASRSTCCR
jgi:cysteine desulfurase/selenocysteine lyase